MSPILRRPNIKRKIKINKKEKKTISSKITRFPSPELLEKLKLRKNKKIKNKISLLRNKELNKKANTKKNNDGPISSLTKIRKGKSGEQKPIFLK